MTRPPSPCGTRSRYASGCRCDDCTRANSAYYREHRFPTGQRPGLPRPLRIPLLGPWVEQAACRGRDTDLWFCDLHDGDYGAARQVCAGCPVRAECLDWAQSTHTWHGMFGGLAPAERRRLRVRQAGL